MTSTNQLSLPLLQAAQAQKHVTLNEALLRLDGLAPLAIASRSVGTPPALVVDGVLYAVPAGAVNGWAGQDGQLAIGSNGGWLFAAPKAGWRAFIVDEGVGAVHDGGAWRAGAVTLRPSGAGMSFGVAEVDHVVPAGVTSVTAFIIPAGAIVFGATARVTETLSGSLSSWQLGNPGAPDRFGSGLGIAQGSWARGVLSQPMAFYAPAPLQLSAVGGSFAAGQVRLAVHYAELALPGA